MRPAHWRRVLTTTAIGGSRLGTEKTAIGDGGLRRDGSLRFFVLQQSLRFFVLQQKEKDSSGYGVVLNMGTLTVS